MKKHLIALFACITLLFGCTLSVDYKIKNYTNYPAIVIDNDLNKTEYYIRANDEIIIKHSNSGSFELKKNEHPIVIKNMFELTTIDYLPSSKIKIVNNSDLNFILKIKNSEWINEPDYSIGAKSKQIIEVYSIAPQFELSQNGLSYEDYSILGNLIIIF